jgi:hypothetical protein
MAQLKDLLVAGNARIVGESSFNDNVTVNGILTGNGSNLTNLNASNIDSGTLDANRLPNSGVTASSYGPSANATPAHSGSFSVPYFTVDAHGRVTSASTKTITLPGSGNTDTKVTQTVTSSNANYPLLLAPSGQTATTTTTSYFDSGVTLNPSTNTINGLLNGYIVQSFDRETSNAKYAALFKDTSGAVKQYIEMHNTAGIILNPNYDGVSDLWSNGHGLWIGYNQLRFNGGPVRLYNAAGATTITTASANLNTTNYIKVGAYNCNSNDIAETLQNCPTSIAFLMEVYNVVNSGIDDETSSTYCYRTRKITDYNGNVWYQSVYSTGTKGSFTYNSWVKSLSGND